MNLTNFYRTRHSCCFPFNARNLTKTTVDQVQVTTTALWCLQESTYSPEKISKRLCCRTGWRAFKTKGKQQRVGISYTTMYFKFLYGTVLYRKNSF